MKGRASPRRWYGVATTTATSMRSLDRPETSMRHRARCTPPRWSGSLSQTACWPLAGDRATSGSDESGRLLDVGCAHQAQRLWITHRRWLNALQEVLVFLDHRRWGDLEHQAVLQPELDDVEERLVALQASAERLGAPAFPCADLLYLLGVEGNRKEGVEGPGVRRCLVLAEDDLLVASRDVERGLVRIDLDHGAVGVATGRHEGAFQRAERHTPAAHQFGKHLGDTLRFARRNRDVVDHLCASLGMADDSVADLRWAMRFGHGPE